MLDYEDCEQRSSYKQWILNYLKEQGVDLSCYERYKPLYLRYRARCLKMKPTTEHAFRNLCTFKSTRANTKYDMHANLLEEKHKIHFCKKEATGSRDVICRIRKDYKLNYKAPPKKEDFEVGTDYRLAYKDWSYLKDELADYEAVKSLIEEFENGQHTAAVGDNNQYYYYQYPYLVRYALKCLGGTIPAECFPESLNEIKEELKELLNKQREAYSKSESETILNDLKSYIGGTKT